MSIVQDQDRINAALKHAKDVLSARRTRVLDGPGYALSCHMIASDISNVECGDHTEEAITALENKKHLEM